MALLIELGQDLGPAAPGPAARRIIARRPGRAALRPVLVVEVGRRLEDLLHEVQRPEVRLERVNGGLQSQQELRHVALRIRVRVLFLYYYCYFFFSFF